MHHKLWCTGHLFDQMVYVMILIGRWLFLQANKLINIRCSDFDPKGHLIMEDGQCLLLVLQIKGKTDDHPVILKLYHDNVCPEFCPVCHLLYYVNKA